MTTRISSGGGRFLPLLALGALAILLGSCGSTDDELTAEEQMVKLAGRPLTSAEITDRIALADLMCDFDGRVLDAIWLELDARELEFQDYVFGQHCPDRLSIYEGARPNTGTVPDDLEPPTPTEEEIESVLVPAVELLESLDTAEDPATDETTIDESDSDDGGEESTPSTTEPTTTTTTR